jgi:hypothetical protein
MMMLFRRIATLERSLLDLARQDYHGQWHLMLWNNNYAERGNVDRIVSKCRKNIDVEVVHSERNHHCVARQSLAAIARGELVMMVDDDIILNAGYLSHFVASYLRLSREGARPVAICACGHRFTREIEGASAEDVWERRRGLQFFDPRAPECDVHFLHANNCMMSRELLLKVAACPPPESDFGLVDDYWMSYVLSSFLDTRTVKIAAASSFEFAPDAFDPRVAMFNRRDVHEARLRLFTYLSQRHWPATNAARPTGDAT